MHSHHIWLMSWLALRAGLAAVTGLVEELILSTDVIFCTSKYTTHLEEEKESQKSGVEIRRNKDKTTYNNLWKQKWQIHTTADRLPVQDMFATGKKIKGTAA